MQTILIRGFINFIEKVKELNIDLDIMLESKKKIYPSML